MIRESTETATGQHPLEKLASALREHAGAKWPALAVFVTSLILFILNAAPGVSFHDSGEFSLALKSGGIPHPPGAPTWMILATTFKFLLPGLEAGRVANLFSSFCGALTLAFLYIFVFRLTISKPTQSRHLAAATATAALLSCGAFLEQSFVAEQYTLLTALLLTVLLAIQSTVGNPKPWKIAAVGTLWALACGNHPSQIVLGLLMVALVIQVRKSIPIYKSIPLGIIGFALGASVFLWLPLATAQNPILCWGRPGTWENFWWCLTRQQWDSRPISAAPVGMVGEWFRSYDLLGQFGLLATLLGGAGLLTWKSEDKRPLVWISLAIIPYCAALLFGHLRQQSMDLQYIRYYGVIDWHLPLYLGLAILGGTFIAYWSSKLTPKAWPMFGGIIIVIACGGIRQLNQQSLTDFKAPKAFVDQNLRSIPENGIAIAFSDDISQMLSYARYGQEQRKDAYVAFGMIQKGYADPQKSWNAEELVRYLQGGLLDRTSQPLLLEKLSRNDILSRPIVTEYTADAPRFAATMVPYGILFLVRDKPVSDAEVKSAEAYTRNKFPEMFESPKGTQHRLAREGFALSHMRRALYFVARGQYDLAKPAAELAITWQPENSEAHFTLGLIYDQTKQYESAEKEYKSAIQLLPDQPGPRQNLAILYATAREFPKALRLANEELRLKKGSPEIVNLIKAIEQNQANSASKPKA